MTGEGYLYVKECCEDYTGTRRSDELKEQMLRERVVWPDIPDSKRLLDYENMDDRTEDYANYIRLRHSARDTVVNALAKSKPFPGDPWR